MRRTRGRPATIVLIVTFALLVGTACSADDDLAARGAADQPAFDEDVATVEEPSGPPAAEMDDVEAAPASPDEPATPAAATLGRVVIRTAEIDLVATDPSVTVDEITRIADEAGGFVATADLGRDREGVLSGTVTIRVPSDDLLATLDALEDLAEGPASRRIDEQDVTVEVADLEARLANLTTYERELNELLTEVRERSRDADELLRIFERVRQVREEIDRLRGRLTVLSDQVSLATITVNVTPAAQAVPVGDPGWRPGDTARAAITSLARTLSGLADALIWFGLAVLPVLTVAAVPFVVGGSLWWRRRHAAVTAAPPPHEP